MVREFYLLSSHGTILFYVAANPNSTVKDKATAMSLTRRAVWGVIRDLKQAGMVHVRKDGRRHHYSVNLDGPFRHPVLKGFRLHAVLGRLVAETSRKAATAAR